MDGFQAAFKGILQGKLDLLGGERMPLLVLKGSRQMPVGVQYGFSVSVTGSPKKKFNSKFL